MKITIESTSKVVHIQSSSGDSVPARIWEGTTERGTPVHCYVTRIAVDKEASAEALNDFERDLKETRAPSAAVQAIPLRLII